MVNSPILRLKDIEKSYQLAGVVSKVLKKISLQINQGELIAIVGPSGSGKSTLMNIIGLLDKADTGDYLLHDRNVQGLSGDELSCLRNESIGFVFQQFNLLPRFNAWQNVALPLTYRNLPQVSINKAVMEALVRVGMEAFISHHPMQLSGGQQQRVAIARAIVGGPTIILADEPTGALDSHTGMEVIKLFLSLNQQGCTIIIVTHDDNVASMCHRRITLADGEIIAERYI